MICPVFNNIECPLADENIFSIKLNEEWVFHPGGEAYDCAYYEKGGFQLVKNELDGLWHTAVPSTEAIYANGFLTPQEALKAFEMYLSACKRGEFSKEILFSTIGRVEEKEQKQKGEG